MAFDDQPTRQEIADAALDAANDNKFRKLEERVKELEENRGINPFDREGIKGSSEGAGFATQGDRIGELNARLNRIARKDGVAEESGLANSPSSAQEVTQALDNLEARVEKAAKGPSIIEQLVGMVGTVAAGAGAGSTDVAKDLPKSPEKIAEEFKAMLQSGKPLTDEQKAALKEQAPLMKKMIDQLQEEIPNKIDAAADKGDMKEVKRLNASARALEQAETALDNLTNPAAQQAETARKTAELGEERKKEEEAKKKDAAAATEKKDPWMLLIALLVQAITGQDILGANQNQAQEREREQGPAVGQAPAAAPQSPATPANKEADGKEETKSPSAPVAAAEKPGAAVTVAAGVSLNGIAQAVMDNIVTPGAQLLNNAAEYLDAAKKNEQAFVANETLKNGAVPTPEDIQKRREAMVGKSVEELRKDTETLTADTTQRVTDGVNAALETGKGALASIVKFIAEPPLADAAKKAEPKAAEVAAVESSKAPAKTDQLPTMVKIINKATGVGDGSAAEGVGKITLESAMENLKKVDDLSGLKPALKNALLTRTNAAIEDLKGAPQYEEVQDRIAEYERFASKLEKGGAVAEPPSPAVDNKAISGKADQLPAMVKILNKATGVGDGSAAEGVGKVTLESAMENLKKVDDLSGLKPDLKNDLLAATQKAIKNLEGSNQYEEVQDLIDQYERFARKLEKGGAVSEQSLSAGKDVTAVGGLMVNGVPDASKTSEPIAKSPEKSSPVFDAAKALAGVADAAEGFINGATRSAAQFMAETGKSLDELIAKAGGIKSFQVAGISGMAQADYKSKPSPMVGTEGAAVKER